MSRCVRISTISLYLPSKIVTVEENIQRAIQATQAALLEKPDVILLPEFFATLGTDPERYFDTVAECADRWAELIRPFQALAREGQCYVFPVGPYRDEQGLVRNAASLINREGEIAGRYYKTHLAPGETEITPGNEYPIFETDFGRVGMMICMDIHYPEIARIYALRGADLLLWSTMSWGPTDRFLTVLLAARAMDNQVYCVHSNFAGIPHLPGKLRGRACIVGPDGETRADTGHRPGIATATVDLDEGYEYWVTGELKGKLPTLKEPMLGLRRPETYGDLVRQDIPWSQWQIEEPLLLDPGEEDNREEPDYLLYG